MFKIFLICYKTHKCSTTGGEPWIFDTQKDSYNLDLSLIEETLKRQEKCQLVHTFFHNKFCWVGTLLLKYVSQPEGLRYRFCFTRLQGKFGHYCST